MALCKNHSYIYFDNLRRVNKSETVLSLIMATKYVKSDKEEERKTEIAKNLISAYNLFLPNGAGSYTGALEQFASQYTIGHELGIWINSELVLNNFALKVANNEITVRDYFDRFFLNYFQPVNNIVVHPLYNILTWFINQSKNEITKDEMESLFSKISNSQIEHKEKLEQTNSLFNMLLGTNYFKIDKEKNILIYSNPISKKDLLQKCNIKYIHGNGYEEAKKDLSELDRYVEYLMQDNEIHTSVDNGSDINSHNTPIQKIFYGVPGCGKSHKIKEILESQSFTNKEYQVSRVVFHPEYTNADFIGQILPGYFDDKETIDYRFSPGPFSQILRRAYLHPDMPFFLIIEEINRGNAAAIFGDIFQLLDRHGKVDSDTINNNTYGEGWSSYSINNDFINWNIRKDADKEGEVFQEIPVYKGLKFQNETKDKKYKSIDIDGIHFSENTGIRLPPNLSLLATMNTSDQNVFTLDNAFQRRWDMELIENKFLYEGEASEKNEATNNQVNATITVNNQYITWENFQSQINSIIGEKGNESGLSSMEDKRLGCWFVKAEYDEITKKYQIKKDVFANKVLKYLWDDAFKFCRDDIFIDKISNFEKLQEDFDKNGFDIFSDKCGLGVKDVSEKSLNDSSVSNQETALEQQSPTSPQPEA